MLPVKLTILIGASLSEPLTSESNGRSVWLSRLQQIRSKLDNLQMLPYKEQRITCVVY